MNKSCIFLSALTRATRPTRWRRRRYMKGDLPDFYVQKKRQQVTPRHPWPLVYLPDEGLVAFTMPTCKLDALKLGIRRAPSAVGF